MSEEITYGETRKINIGDYEGRDIFLSWKAKLRNVNGRGILEIHEHESATVEDLDKTFKKNFKHLQRVVSECLDHREKKIREWASEWTGDYPLEKLENPPK